MTIENASTPALSRAINVNLSEPQVLATCEKHSASVSAIEPIASGGTRVVLKNIIDADRMRFVFGKKVMQGLTMRTRWPARR